MDLLDATPTVPIPAAGMLRALLCQTNEHSLSVISHSVLRQTDYTTQYLAGKYSNAPPQQNKCYLKRAAKDIWGLSISSL